MVWLKMRRTPDQTIRATTAKGGPGFFWQGVLILLPIAALAAAGLFTLRQDRLLAEGEARQAAQRHADAIRRAVWATLNASPGVMGETTSIQTLRVSRQGQLLDPPPAPALPAPQSGDPGEVPPELRDAWLTAFRPEADADNGTKAIAAARRLVAASLPDGRAAAIRYRLGILLAAGGDADAATRMLAEVESRYPDAVGESGQPLRPLAAFKRLEISNGLGSAGRPDPAAISGFCSNLVFAPTFLSPHLLSRTRDLASRMGFSDLGAIWERERARHEALRPLANALVQLLATATNAPAGSASIPPVPTVFWLGTPAGEWLAVRSNDGADGYRIVCRWMETGSGGAPGSESALVAAGLGEAETALLLPDWFGFNLVIAGRTIQPGRRSQPGGPERSAAGADAGTVPARGPELLGTSSEFENGVELLRVNVHLVHPQRLYARQTTRTRTFGALIGVSVAVALTGFVLARRAFDRQRQLAEMKSNFVSSVSHELRAPIASVRLMAESLDRGAVREPAKQHEYFRFIVQECRRLGTLIENVLDFARIEQGRKEYEFEPADVPALIRQTVKLMEPAAAEKQVTLVTRLSETAAADVRLDAQAMQQALVNLIDNALKHSPAGSAVTVGVQRSRTNPDRVCLSVEDSGPGIPVEDQQRIFERFYRRGSELRRDTQGVGIGLSIVKHIVEAHGGCVVVESAPGHGSRFTIEVPISGNPPPESRDP